MDYKIGCSGYYYPGWKGKFYPAQLPVREWLSYYSSIFNTVELNGTFYRIPTLASLKKYTSVTPDDFCFSVKINRSITHIRRLKETKQLIKDFQELVEEGLEHKLANFLFQFPASFHYSEKNLDLLISNIPNEQRNVIEFRHPSWWNEDVRVAFENAQLTFCNIDYPGLKSSLMHTTSLFYLRLHGNPDLFKSAYEPDELENIAQNIPDNHSNAWVYFNNTFFEAGYTNASQLLDIVNHHSLIS